MRYKITKGVVYEEICGQGLLISTREAREICPYLTELNESSSFIWKFLQEEKDSDSIIEEIIKEYGILKEEADTALNAFLEQMEKQRFITREAEQ